jgi:hypothetical protein
MKHFTENPYFATEIKFLNKNFIIQFGVKLHKTLFILLRYIGKRLDIDKMMYNLAIEIFGILYFAAICSSNRWNETWITNPPLEPFAGRIAQITIKKENKDIVLLPGSKPNHEIPPYCEKGSNCLLTVDSVFTLLYDIPYSPTKLQATVEDHITTRYVLIDYLQQRYQYTSYLEIGCEHDRNFNRVKSYFDISVGVDPEQGGNYRMTSDQFFEINTQSFDIIFIDGLHEAHQVYRDIYNSLRFLNDNGTILIHDSNPHFFNYALYPRPEGQGIWNGDVFKAVIASRLFDGVEIVVGDFDHGVGIMRRRRNHHPLPSHWVNRILHNPLDSLTFNDLAVNRDTLLRLMTIQEVRDWLDEETQQQ